MDQEQAQQMPEGEGADQEQEPMPALPPARGAKGKVLIVDDEPDVLESTALVVETLGYEAIRLHEADRVLEVVEREQPGVLLQDLRMPGLNVAGLVAALRSRPETGQVHIVFFSAGRDLQDTARRLRAWGVLPKPFRVEQLAQLLESGFRPLGAYPTPSADAHAEIKTAFHEYWDLLAALNNYLLILQRLEGLPFEARRCVDGLGELVLKLEARTERLRAGLMSVIADGDRVRPRRRPAAA